LEVADIMMRRLCPKHGGERDIEVLHLENVAFKDQWIKFRRADMLVALSGTAAHNSLFMKRGTVVALIMQQGWCRCRWWFERQALLLGIHALSLCDEPDVTSYHYRWHLQSWLCGPWYTKNSPATVNNASFAAMMDLSSSILDDLRAARKSGTLPQFLPSSRVPFWTPRTGPEMRQALLRTEPFRRTSQTLRLRAVVGDIDVDVGGDITAAVVAQEQSGDIPSFHDVVWTMNALPVQTQHCVDVFTEVGDHDVTCVSLEDTNEYATTKLTNVSRIITANTNKSSGRAFFVHSWLRRNRSVDVAGTDTAFMFEPAVNALNEMRIAAREMVEIYVEELQCSTVTSEIYSRNASLPVEPMLMQRWAFESCASSGRGGARAHLNLSCLRCIHDKVTREILVGT